jgi:hypothetical protein
MSCRLAVGATHEKGHSIQIGLSEEEGGGSGCIKKGGVGVSLALVSSAFLAPAAERAEEQVSFRRQIAYA